MPQSLSATSNINILSNFAKGTQLAKAINFGPSGGSNCPSTCQLNVTGNPNWQPADGWCYAMRLELYRPVLLNRLTQLLKLSVADICLRAMSELHNLLQIGINIHHVRFCSAGSMRQFASLSRRDRLMFVRFAQWLAHHIPTTWLPIADELEARQYSRLIGKWITVRHSVSNDRFLSCTTPCSTVVGQVGQTWHSKLAQAYELAKCRLAATGRKTIVCPAIVQAWQYRWGHGKNAPKAKCGSRGNGCDACCNRNLDIVFPKT